jgi:putative hydrolase of HD superfamily
MTGHDAILEMLLEVQQLDRVPRLGFSLRGVPDPESVTEHSWHVAFLVWSLAPRIRNLDAARALEIALIHDLAEVRLGDLPLTASRYLPAGAKNEAEKRALADLAASLGHLATDLLDEYQKGESLEARTVKACDKLQLMLKVTAYERAGAGGLDEFWHNPGNFPDLGIQAIDDLVEALRDHHRSARG